MVCSIVNIITSQYGAWSRTAFSKRSLSKQTQPDLPSASTNVTSAICVCMGHLSRFILRAAKPLKDASPGQSSISVQLRSGHTERFSEVQCNSCGVGHALPKQSKE